VNAVLADPALATTMGAAGRGRAVDAFSWPAIAQETVELYRSLVSR
jgi:alpha-maltose-1-phosphate synthase